MNRREFFGSAGKELHSRLKSLSFDEIKNAIDLVKSGFTQSHSELRELPTTATPLLQSLDPINTSGHPFGGRVSCMTLFEILEFNKLQTLIAIFGHDTAPFGVSMVRIIFKKEQNKWDYLVTSEFNRTINENSLITEVSQYRLPTESTGLGPITCMTQTTWGTILCGGPRANSQSGIYEINPRTGFIQNHINILVNNPQNIEVKSLPWLPIEVIITSEDSDVFSYKSCKPYNARAQKENFDVLLNGVFKKLDSKAEVKIKKDLKLLLPSKFENIKQSLVVDGSKISVLTELS